MRNNAYWNETGELQNEYNTMLAAQEDGTFAFTKAAENTFHTYYRYYNDGDLPGWARNYSGFTTYDWKWNQRKLTEKGEEELEQRVTERIAIEWKRYQKKIAK